MSLVGDETGREIRQLHRWLRQDEALRGVTITAQHASAENGEMGSLTETLRLLLEPQGILTAVAASVATWAGVRRRNIRIHMSNGEKSVEVEALKCDDPEQAATRLWRELGGQ